VTVNAWKAQTQNNRDIEEVFLQLEDVATGVVKVKLEEFCIKAENLVASLPVNTFV
jgi:hypothetical protein